MTNSRTATAPSTSYVVLVTADGGYGATTEHTFGLRDDAHRFATRLAARYREAGLSAGPAPAIEIEIR